MPLTFDEYYGLVTLEVTKKLPFRFSRDVKFTNKYLGTFRLLFTGLFYTSRCRIEGAAHAFFVCGTVSKLHLYC